jgi:hypothetical protein
MTADEFEAAYAARSGVTIESLHKYGKRARPCRCEAPECEGWQMISDRLWADPFIRMQAGVISVEEMERSYNEPPR